MTLTIDITPQLESQLREEAAKCRLNTSDYVVNVIQESIQRTRNNDAPHLVKDEADLMRQINIGLSQETWQRYHELIEKRRTENLTVEEQTSLIEISDEIEKLNARRIEHLSRLARHRNVSLRELMQQLGIEKPDYA